MNEKKLDRAISQEVVSDREKFEYFFGTYWKQITAASAVLVVLISLAFAFYRHHQSAIREANAALSEAKTAEEIIAVLAKHPSESASVAARLRLASLYLADKKYDQAAEEFKKVAGDENLSAPIRFRAMLNCAYLTEQSGKEAGAAEEFSAVGRNPEVPINLRAEANYSAGRIYCKLKDFAKARAALELAASGAESEPDAFGWGKMAAIMANSLPAATPAETK